MPLNLIRRLIKGAPLTAAEHDGNLNVLEAAINSADADVLTLQERLDAFRDARTFYVSKTGSNAANGTSPGEPLLTIGAAVTAANAYVTANPGAAAKISVAPGKFVEPSLPFRLKPNILAQGSLQRGTIIEPAAGQELNGFWALDSGCMVCDFRFAGHQATDTSTTNSAVGTRAWAVRFNEQANGGQGVFLTASPYIKDCASITAEDDAGLAGSTSTGDTGGGVEVDGAKCHPNSPIRSMVVYGFTQQNLGGPGCVVKNDAYAELVSFFGLFGTWHVQCETGGQATLSGGGCSEFGIYGLVADGYSATPLYSGTLRVEASIGALNADVVSMSSNRLGSSSRPASGQIMLLGDAAYVVQSSTPIDSSGTVVSNTDPNRAGYRVTFYNPSGNGLASNVSQGTTADFRQRSQISAGCHSANYVGSGTNYSALPWNGGVPVRANEAVERNLGRVFGLIVNDVGDVRIAGGAFSVDGTTGAVTINTSQFNLSGLNAIGPFSRNGGASTVGVQLQEVSNNTSLLASTGSSDGNTAPTQYAVTQYLQSYYTPLNDGRLSDTREWNATTVSQAEAEAGTATTRRAFTAQRVFQAIAAWWAGSAAATKLAGIATGATANSSDATLLNRANHTGTQSAGTITGLASVATTGAYADLSGRPTLGTSAALDTGTTAGKVVALDGTGKLPAVDGSQLTGLPAQGVTSVGLSAPAGFSVSGSPITSSGTLSLSFAAGYSLPTTAKQSQWDTAYAGYLQWDGGATGLNAATARTSLGLGTAATTDASAYATAAQGALADTAVQPAGLSGYLTSATAATTYQPLDSDLTSIAALTTTTFGRSLLTKADAASARTTLGAGTGNGTVTSVGLSLPGLFSVSGSPVTDSGTLTAALATQAAGRVLAGPTTGADAAPTFRALVAGDLGTGTASASTYLRGDLTWGSVSVSPGGTSGQLQFNSSGSFAGVSGSSVDGSGNITLGSRFISSLNGAASAPPVAVTGTWLTSGTSTTTKPQVLIEPTGTTSTAWSAAGTGLGVNAPSGFTGNLLDLQVNGTRAFAINDNGSAVIISGRCSVILGSLAYTDRFNIGNPSDRGIAIWGCGLFSPSDHVLEQRSGAAGQTWRLYNTFTNASNYERLSTTWSSNVCYTRPENAGTGSARLYVPVTGSTTVASLPSAATAGTGARSFVTDATATTFLSTVAGGGTNRVPVVSDGTNWLIG